MSDEVEAPFLINVAKDANVNASGRSKSSNRLSGLNSLDIPGRRRDYGLTELQQNGERLSMTMFFSRRSSSRRSQEPKKPGNDASSSPRGRHGSSPGTGGLRRRFRRRSTVKSSYGRDGDADPIIGNTHANEAGGRKADDGSDSRPDPKSKSKPDCGPSVARQPIRREPRPPLPVSRSSCIRRLPVDPDETLREKFKQRLRSPADGMPEVHFIGEIAEGSGFPARFGEDDGFLSCKWHLEWGKAWSFLQGEREGQTQYASSCLFASDGNGGVVETAHVWNHPIDVHFASASMQGWPRLILQIWELDEFGRSLLGGYGFVHLPTNPGHHELEVHCWKPTASLWDELRSFFLGTSTCLLDEDVVFGKAWEDRVKLVTVSAGVVSAS
ncbi:LOW QUALITY PROTEIN: hypothetical protein ACHAXS_002027 [Conticribra weissflogii]